MDQAKKPADFPKEAVADLLENATATKRSEAGERRKPNGVIPTGKNRQFGRFFLIKSKVYI